MTIRRLIASDAAEFQRLRLIALRDCPTAFSATYEQECDMPLSLIQARLAEGSGRDFFGAWETHGNGDGDGAELAGMVGVSRPAEPKLRHKALIFGMYIAASQRGKGMGRALLEHALTFARGLNGLHQISLTATADNAAAIGLYEAAGFRQFGLEPRAIMVDGVCYDVAQLALLLDQHHPL